MTREVGVTQLQAVGDDGGLRPRVSLRGKSHADQYDRNGFYVRARNRHDHTFKWSGDLDPDVAIQIEKLIASGALLGTPIDSMGAFVRDAMYHNLERIKSMVADPQQAAHLQATADDYRRLAQADSMTRDIASKKVIVQGAREALEEAFASRDDHMVQSLLDLYEPMVDRLRDPYAGQLVEVLDRARSRRK